MMYHIDGRNILWVRYFHGLIYDEDLVVLYIDVLVAAIPSFPAGCVQNPGQVKMLSGYIRGN